MGQAYEISLAAKHKLVIDLMKPYVRVDKIIGAANPYEYRNKVHAVLGKDKKGNIIAGTYEENSHKIVAVDKCLIDNPTADQIIGTITRLMKSFKYEPYNEDTGRGFLRHILIRTAHSTGQIMVVIVTAEVAFPSKNNFVKALIKEHPSITTIVQNINNKRTSMVLGDREQVIYGRGFIEDILCGCRFKLSPKSFYQVNSEQTEILYNKAYEFAELTGNETIIDAYCGIGTIGIAAAKRVKQVVGVEVNPAAIADAKINLRNNNVTNAKYICEDAGKFMEKEAAAGNHYDIVFMDPPRAGADKKFMDSVIKLGPDKIVYISCNPVTLADNVKYFTQKGYVAKRCVPVEMFPWAEHVETVVLLSRNEGTKREG